MNNKTIDKTKLWQDIESLYEHIKFLDSVGDHNLAKNYNEKLIEKLWQYIELDEVL